MLLTHYALKLHVTLKPNQKAQNVWLPKTAGSIKNTRVNKSAVVDVKGKYHHLIVSMVSLKLKFQNGYYFPGSSEVYYRMII